MSRSQQIGSECVQSLMKRKDLEAYIGLLSSRKNKLRKDFIEKIAEDKKLTTKELKNLLTISHIKKPEYLVLKSLFSRISWKTEVVDINEPGVFPGTFSLSSDTDYSRSTIIAARKILKAKGLIGWKNQYEDSQRSKGLDSQNNTYSFTSKLIALAQFTQLCQKNSLNEQEKEFLDSLIGILKEDLLIEKTAHQKSGMQGALTKIKNKTNLEELKTILAELKEKHTQEQKSLVSRFENLVSEMAKPKKKNIFEISEESRITKKSSKIIAFKNCTRGVRGLDQGVQESDPGGPGIGPIILEPNTPIITKPNKTPPATKRRQKGCEEKNRQEEEFNKLFKLFFDLFSRKVSPKEKKLFKENFHAQGFSFDDVRCFLEYFSKDKYLRSTTTSINRVFEAERIKNITDDVRSKITKNGWKPEYSKHLGDIKKLTKIFPKVGDVISWARGEPEKKPDTTRISELIQSISKSKEQTQTLMKAWISLPNETKELGYKSVWTGPELIGFLKTDLEVANAV